MEQADTKLSTPAHHICAGRLGWAGGFRRRWPWAVTEGPILEGAFRWGEQEPGCRAGGGGIGGSRAGLGIQLCFGGQVQRAHPQGRRNRPGEPGGEEWAPCHSTPHPSWTLPSQASLWTTPPQQLTVRAGAALPAVPANAGEGVPTAHTGAPVHTGVGQATAVLGCDEKEGGLLIGPWRTGSPHHAPEPGAGTKPVPRPLTPRASSPMLQVLPFQPGGQAQRKVSPLS